MDVVDSTIHAHLQLELGAGNDELSVQTTDSKSCEILGGNGFGIGNQSASSLGSPQLIFEFEAGNMNQDP